MRLCQVLIFAGEVDDLIPEVFFKVGLDAIPNILCFSNIDGGAAGLGIGPC